MVQGLVSEAIAAVAQLVEYVLGKDGVMGSSPISSFCQIMEPIVSGEVFRAGSFGRLV